LNFPEGVKFILEKNKALTRNQKENALKTDPFLGVLMTVTKIN
jgi:hypothetical protein